LDTPLYKAAFAVACLAVGLALAWIIRESIRGRFQGPDVAKFSLGLFSLLMLELVFSVVWASSWWQSLCPNGEVPEGNNTTNALGFAESAAAAALAFMMPFIVTYWGQQISQRSTHFLELAQAMVSGSVPRACAGPLRERICNVRSELGRFRAANQAGLGLVYFFWIADVMVILALIWAALDQSRPFLQYALTPILHGTALWAFAGQVTTVLAFLRFVRPAEKQLESELAFMGEMLHALGVPEGMRQERERAQMTQAVPALSYRAELARSPAGGMRSPAI
jgi:hypothetical protein